MKSSSRSSRRTWVSPWVCVLVAGLVLATPALVSASSTPVAGHTRDATMAPNSVGFWIKVGSLGLQILSNIVTALEEIDKLQEENGPAAPPRADGPPWQPTENPAPQVIHIN